MKMRTFDWVYLVFALFFLSQENKQPHWGLSGLCIDLGILIAIYLVIHFAMEFDRKRRERGVKVTK